MSGINFVLLCTAILALLILAIPEPQECWLPPDAPTRGIYIDCWEAFELWA